MNYKRSLIGVLVVGVAGLFWGLSSDHVRFHDIVIGPLHNHDEPVIIEDGSGGNLAQAAEERMLSVDFDRNNGTSGDPGSPVLDDEIVLRTGAHPVARIRMWVDGSQVYCGAGKEECLVDGGAMSLTTNGRPIDFIWNEKGHGLAMISRGQKVKRKDVNRPSVFTVEDPKVWVESIRLKKKAGGWATYSLRTPGTKRIELHLCFLDDAVHCDDYKPK